MSKSNSYLTEHGVHLLLESFSAEDWHEATQCAKMLCIGLPDVASNELLHEAIVLLLDGSRRFPQNINPLAALYFVMRSIASHIRRRMKEGPIDYEVEVISDFQVGKDIGNTVIPISFASPEKIAQDRELISEVERLFRDDYEVLRLLHLWSEGALGTDVRLELGMSSKRFEAANKRLRRALAAHKTRSAQ